MTDLDIARIVQFISDVTHAVCNVIIAIVIDISSFLKLKEQAPVSLPWNNVAITWHPCLSNHAIPSLHSMHIPYIGDVFILWYLDIVSGIANYVVL